MSLYPEVQFYDYTKWMPKERKTLGNYDLTFSRAEDTTDEWMEEVLSSGHNLAVVFDELPDTYMGRKVVDGDLTDLRFLDEKGGIVVGLYPKGEAKKDTSGFVVIIGDIL
jgi:hypothetical protein